jgi:hypothetical protein
MNMFDVAARLRALGLDADVWEVEDSDDHELEIKGVYRISEKDLERIGALLDLLERLR